MLKTLILNLLILGVIQESKGFFKNDFKTSQHGKDFLKQKEGYSEIAYFDGTWTIGYGNTFYPDGRPVRKGDRITTDQGTQILDFVLKTTFEPVVNNLVTASITQSQFDALISYAYNRGNQKFKTSRLLEMINQDPQNKAIAEQFVTEWGSNTRFKNGLIRRRKQEAELYFSEVKYTIQEQEQEQQTVTPKNTFMFILWIAAGILLTLSAQALAKRLNFSLKITRKV